MVPIISSIRAERFIRLSCQSMLDIIKWNEGKMEQGMGRVCNRPGTGPFEKAAAVRDAINAKPDFKERRDKHRSGAKVTFSATH